MGLFLGSINSKYSPNGILTSTDRGLLHMPIFKLMSYCAFKPEYHIFGIISPLLTLEYLVMRKFHDWILWTAGILSRYHAGTWLLIATCTFTNIRRSNLAHGTDRNTRIQCFGWVTNPFGNIVQVSHFCVFRCSHIEQQFSVAGTQSQDQIN